MFDKHILDFNKNILGLRGFVDLIDPFLTKKQKEQREPIEYLMRLAVVNELLKQKTGWKKNEREKLEKQKSKLDAEILRIYKKPIELKLEKIVEEKDGKKKISGVKISFKTDKDVIKYLENATYSSEYIELLYKNSLISLLSSTEWFFSEILHYYYDRFPDAAGIQKRAMTLSDLKSFKTVNDAEKYLIDVKIEEVLRGSFESWISLLKTELSLKLGYINSVEDELIEIYQRRNLLVHNGGIVNSIYLSKVKEPFRKKTKINEQISVDKEYLDNAICKLQKSFILIASELWKNLDKNDKKRGDVLTDIVYENLIKGRWDICEGLCYFIINDKQLESVDRCVSQLNYWLCKKRTQQFDSIKEEIFNTDYSDKMEIFQLGLFALKEDKKSFFKVLPIALDSGQLNIEKLEEFPIFEEMRNSDEYEKFKEESKYFKEPNKKIERLSTDMKEKKLNKKISKISSIKKKKKTTNSK